MTARHFDWFADERIAVHEAAIGDARCVLLPEEAAAVGRAAPRRIMEFAAGRHCARAALAELGFPPEPLLPGTDRAPSWPEGFAGSITHTQTHCAAAAARKASGVASIGIDLEPAEDLPADILESVCGEAERRWLAAQPSHRRGVLARAIFAAKECAFKAQFPLSGRILEFEDFNVMIEPEGGMFAAQFTRDCPPFEAGAMLAGGLRINRNYISCGVTINERIA